MTGAICKLTSAAVMSLVSAGVVSGAVLALSSHSGPLSAHTTSAHTTLAAPITPARALSSGNTVWE
jgi:hypothetical protein